MKFFCHGGTPHGGLVPPLEASQSHHTGYDSSRRLIVPAQRPLTHKISMFTRDRHHGKAGFEPTTPASKRPQTDLALSG